MTAFLYLAGWPCCGAALAYMQARRGRPFGAYVAAAVAGE